MKLQERQTNAKEVSTSCCLMIRSIQVLLLCAGYCYIVQKLELCDVVIGEKPSITSGKFGDDLPSRTLQQPQEKHGQRM